MSGTSTKGISSFPPKGGSILDRGSPKSLNQALTENQSAVDHLVENGVKTATDEKMMASFMGAGLAGRFIRLGTVGSGAAFSPSLLRWTSHATALAGESAVFAGLEREFGRWDGHAPTRRFQEDWARAAINLASLKFLGGAARGENIVVQHLLTDLGMVAGHNAGYALNVTEKPQGNFAQQMVEAEAMNLAMQGSMVLLHGLSPKLSATEKAVDFSLNAKEADRPKPAQGFFPDWALAAEGPGNVRSRPPEPVKKGPEILQMSAEGGNKGAVPLEETPMTSAMEKRSAYVQGLVGQVIDGRYKILHQLAEGGMGIVLVCEHQELGKRFALKILNPELSNDANSIARFKEEARAASAIGNPHIINISDFGKFEDGRTYFVMEYLDGTPLQQLVLKGPVPTPRLLNIAEQLADGLAAAHAEGIIHRDLKPDNIFLSRQGKKDDFVKILDFGLAKGSNKTGAPRLTKAGTIFGTPEYMSPEQSTGNPVVGPASDIYSFGIILYEMVSGKVPFHSDSQDFHKILTGHMYTPLPPLRDQPGTPKDLSPGLEAIINKCLQKFPENRYQSMEEVIVDLEKVKKGEMPDALDDVDMPTQVRVNHTAVRPGSPPNGQPAVLPPGITGTTPSRLETFTDLNTIPVRRRWPIIAGLGSGAAALILGAVILSSGKAPPETKSVQPPPTLPTQEPPRIEDKKVELPPPPKVTPTQDIKLNVEPNGTRVYSGDKELGKDLVTISLEEGQTLEVEIRRDGYVTKKQVIDGSKPQLSVRLERDRSAPRPSGNPRTPPPAGSGKKNAYDGVVDPWKDPPKK